MAVLGIILVFLIWSGLICYWGFILGAKWHKHYRFELDQEKKQVYGTAKSLRTKGEQCQHDFVGTVPDKHCMKCGIQIIAGPLSARQQGESK